MQRDGDIVGMDGVSNINFDVAENYIVVIKHRNHLGLESTNVLTAGVASTTDFTVLAAPVCQISFGMKNVSGRMVMMSGDANHDGQVNAVDRNIYYLAELGNPYVYGTTMFDLNLDGTVNSVDKNSFYTPNNSKATQIGQCGFEYSCNVAGNWSGMGSSCGSANYNGANTYHDPDMACARVTPNNSSCDTPVAIAPTCGAADGVQSSLEPVTKLCNTGNVAGMKKLLWGHVNSPVEPYLMYWRWYCEDPAGKNSDAYCVAPILHYKEWVTGAWGACTSSTKSRTVHCQSEDGSTNFPDANCTETKPATSTSCSSLYKCGGIVANKWESTNVACTPVDYSSKSGSLYDDNADDSDGKDTIVCADVVPNNARCTIALNLADCGLADSVNSANKPVALCTAGVASAVTDEWPIFKGGSDWTWTCTADDVKSCSALHLDWSMGAWSTCNVGKKTRTVACRDRPDGGGNLYIDADCVAAGSGVKPASSSTDGCGGKGK